MPRKKKLAENPVPTGQVQAVDAARKKNGQWAKGVSGNPAGGVPGRRNKATMAVEELLDGQAEKLTKKCIEQALGGCTLSMKLCLERIAPPRKDRAVSFDSPPLNNLEDAIPAIGGVVNGVASGQLTVPEGAAISAMIGNFARVVESLKHEERIQALEKQMKAQQSGQFRK
jgi:hypothetical protein